MNHVYRGKRALSPMDIESLYGESGHVSQEDLQMLQPVNDLFALAEACLIADAIQTFDSEAKRTGIGFTAGVVVEDIKTAVRDVHLSGAMHEAVTQNMPKYIRS